MKKGFTLIELLVVVLIIGILSAAALPQYRKTVTKARVTEILVNSAALEKAIAICRLEQKTPSECKFGKLDVDLSKGMTCEGNICESDYFRYSIGNSGSGGDIVSNYDIDCKKGDCLILNRIRADGSWDHHCKYNEEFNKKGKEICDILEKSYGYWTSTNY